MAPSDIRSVNTARKARPMGFSPPRVRSDGGRVSTVITTMSTMTTAP